MWPLIAAMACTGAWNRVDESAELTTLAQAEGTPPDSMKACETVAPCSMPLIAAGNEHTAALKSDGTV